VPSLAGNVTVLIETNSEVGCVMALQIAPADGRIGRTQQKDIGWTE